MSIQSSSTDTPPFAGYTLRGGSDLCGDVERWDATQDATGLPVTVWIAAADTAAGRNLTERARLLASVQHFGVPGLIDAGELEGEPTLSFLITQRPSGESWGHWVSGGPDVTEPDAAAVRAAAAGLADAVAAVHRAGFTLGGLTAEDVVLDNAGRPWIVGIDRLARPVGLGQARQERADDLAGVAGLLRPLVLRPDNGDSRRDRRRHRRFAELLDGCDAADAGAERIDADRLAAATRWLAPESSQDRKRRRRRGAAALVAVVGLGLLGGVGLNARTGELAPPEPLRVAETDERPVASFAIPQGVTHVAWLAGGERFVLADGTERPQVGRLGGGPLDDFYKHFGVQTDGRVVQRVRVVGSRYLLLLSDRWGDLQPMRILDLEGPRLLREWGENVWDAETHAEIFPLVAVIDGEKQGTEILNLTTGERELWFSAGSHMEDAGAGGRLVHRTGRTALRISDANRVQPAIALHHTDHGAIRNAGIKAAVFSPDGRFVAAAYKSHLDDATQEEYDQPAEAWERLIRVALFDTATGDLVRQFVGHRDYVDHLDFSADGRLLLSTGIDGGLFVWSTTTGFCLLKFEGKPGREHAFACFTPDGRGLMRAGPNGTQLEQWDLAPLLDGRF